MKSAEVNEIIEILPKCRTKFYYFKDKYALDLLQLLVQDEIAVSELKKSSLKRLLQKPVVKEVLARSGTGRLSMQDFEGVWPDRYECYLLTLGTWGSERHYSSAYYQTSRAGMNLVLQLNFSRRHNEIYRRLIHQHAGDPFVYDEHPIARKPYNTCAWARLDIDMTSGEALIEEIQTDWIRLAIYGSTTVEQLVRMQDGTEELVQRTYGDTNRIKERIKKYINEGLSSHIELWDEAMLSAAIWFLSAELGIQTIFYHTFETGNRLKQIYYSKPPRSLYESLPRRFCFTKTHKFPQFLEKQVAKLQKTHDIKFYLLTNNPPQIAPHQSV